MGHGGKREGSGRKTGSANLKSRAIADKRAAVGLPTPLEVMLENMDFYHMGADQALQRLLDLPAAGEAVAASAEGLELAEAGATAAIDALRNILNLRRLSGAAAVDAAPFMHPRLGQVEHEIDISDPLKELFKAICGTGIRPRDG